MIYYGSAICRSLCLTAGTEARHVAETAVNTMDIAAKGKASFSEAIDATPTP